MQVDINKSTVSRLNKRASDIVDEIEMEKRVRQRKA